MKMLGTHRLLRKLRSTGTESPSLKDMLVTRRGSSHLTEKYMVSVTLNSLSFT